MQCAYKVPAGGGSEWQMHVGADTDVCSMRPLGANARCGSAVMIRSP